MQTFKAGLLLLFTAALLRVSAATVGVTVPSANTLTAGFVPYAAGAGTSQLAGNSPFRRASATVGAMNTWTEDNESLTDAANLTLNWLTGRTKTVTLNQNTTFAFSNTPAASTNIQRMVVRVTGDGVSSVAFTGALWQTPQITVPDAGVITLYVFEGSSGVVTGYAGVGSGGGGGGAALWSSSGGRIVPDPAVDVVAITSQLADNPTNVALVVDTAVTWTNYDASMLKLGTGNSPKIAFTVQPKILIGQTTNQVSSDSGIDIINTFPFGPANTLEINLNNYLPGNAGLTASSLFSYMDDSPYGESALNLAINNSGATGHFNIDVSNDGILLDGYFAGATILSMNPTVASGSAIAYLFGTSQVLTNGDKFMSVQNAGVEQLSVSPVGEIMIGRDATSIFGSGGANFFRGIRNLESGDQTLAALKIESTYNTAEDAYGMFEAGVNTNYVSVSAIAIGSTNNTYSWVYTASPDSGLLLWQGTVSGGILMSFEPSAADGSTPYKLDTSVVHTSGNLLEIANNGTNQFAITHDGELLIGQAASGFTGDLISGIRDITLGDGDSVSAAFELKESAVSNRRALFAWGGALNGGTGTTMLFNDGTNGNKIYISQLATDFTLTISDSVNSLTNYTIIHPTESAAGTAYYFNTDKAHTSGNLFEIANNGTNNWFLAIDNNKEVLATVKNFIGTDMQIGVNAVGNAVMKSTGNGGVILTGTQFCPEGGATLDLADITSSSKWRDLALSRDANVIGNIIVNGSTNTVGIFHGNGSPEGSVTASPGSLYLDFGGENYIKNTGAGNTGWKLVTHAFILFLALPRKRGVKCEPRQSAASSGITVRSATNPISSLSSRGISRPPAANPSA